MKVVFKYSLLKEFQRLCYNLYELNKGFFRENGFTLSTINNGNVFSVVVPQQIHTLKNINSRLTATNIENKAYIKLKQTSYSDLYTILKDDLPISTKHIERDWRKLEEPFNKILTTLFAVHLSDVTVYITKYGTIASYLVFDNKLIIFLRKDADVSQIAFCILSYYVHSHYKDLPWKTKQHVVDFLMKSSKIANLFNDFTSILQEIPKVPNYLVEQSNLLYSKLGLISPTFKNDEKFIYLNSKRINLSKSEYKLLKLLIQNSNDFTSFDAISSILWGNDYSEFSLQAIAKLVERIRKKIKNCGVEYNCIITKRKVGYMLLN